jgi:CDP-diacylglycerol--glycerol-3-phosphate 3-phosphatidyltransferase
VNLRRQIPFALVGLRFALGPCFPVAYTLGAPGWVYVALLFMAIVSDIFDGTLARRWNTVTPQLRRWDSNADSVCFGLATITVVLLRADDLAPWRWPLAAVFFLIIAQNVLNVVRYGRQPAYHMWSGKIWSIIFCITLTALFLDHPCAWAIDLLIVVSLYNSTENIIASTLLPRPMTDIPTMFHAIRIARDGDA